MDTIKDRNGMEEEDIKKRWQEYKKELYKKGLNDPDDHGEMITHLCEVNWALGVLLQTKVLEVMEFQLSYFKYKKMKLLMCCIQYARAFGKLSTVHRTGKCQFTFQSQRREMSKNIQTTAQLQSFQMLVR